VILAAAFSFAMYRVAQIPSSRGRVTTNATGVLASMAASNLVEGYAVTLPQRARASATHHLAPPLSV